MDTIIFTSHRCIFNCFFIYFLEILILIIFFFDSLIAISRIKYFRFTNHLFKDPPLKIFGYKNFLKRYCSHIIFSHTLVFKESFS